MDFKLVSDYAPMGDQPEAIAQLVGSIRHGSKHNTLLGVTRRAVPSISALKKSRLPAVGMRPLFSA